jgi:hypothetical protein
LRATVPGAAAVLDIDPDRTGSEHRINDFGHAPEVIGITGLDVHAQRHLDHPRDGFHG